MANQPFNFKQFKVEQDKCAMKIGTDAVLLGAWSNLKTNPFSILDIGSGFVLAILTQIIIFPYFGYEVTMLKSIHLALIFTGILLRSSLIQRVTFSSSLKTLPFITKGLTLTVLIFPNLVLIVSLPRIINLMGFIFPSKNILTEIESFSFRVSRSTFLM